MRWARRWLPRLALPLTAAAIFVAGVVVLSREATWAAGADGRVVVPPLVPDRALFALLLFVGERYGGIAEPAPPSFQFVSLAALVFTLGALVKVLTTAFSTAWTWLVVNARHRGHVVVCGLSRKGAQLARTFRAAGERVIVIEKDAAHPGIEELRADGVRVHVGDAASPSVLRAAGARHARRVFCVCDDATNHDVLHALEVALGSRRPAPECHMHIWDRHLFEEMLHRKAEGDGASRRGGALLGDRTHFFSVAILGASALMKWEAPEREAGRVPLLGGPGEANHYVLVGVGALGQEFVVQLTRRWAVSTGGVPAASRPTFHLVDRAASAHARELAAEHPQLARHWVLVPHRVVFPSAAFGEGRWLEALGAEVPRRVIVALPGDLETLTAALVIRRQAVRREWSATHILARFGAEGGVEWCEALHDNESPWSSLLQPFRLIEEALPRDFARLAPMERVATVLHREYRREVQEQRARLEREGVTPPDKPADREWLRLGEKWRESNRQQATSIVMQLSRLNPPCIVEVGEGPGDALREEELELLAVREHYRWMAEKVADGYVYAPGRDDDGTPPTHPMMLPWSELAEQDKAYDRALVAKWPAALAAGGLVIRRQGAGRPAVQRAARGGGGESS